MENANVIADTVHKSMPLTPKHSNIQIERISNGLGFSADHVRNTKEKITEEKMTPCKHHVATPPMPHSTNKEFKTLLSTKI